MHVETEGPQHDSTIYRILQNLAGLESEYPPRRDRDRVVGLRVAPGAFPLLSYYEVPEAADLDLAGQLALLKLGLDRLKDLLNNLSGLLLRKSHRGCHRRARRYPPSLPCLQDRLARAHDTSHLVNE